MAVLAYVEVDLWDRLDADVRVDGDEQSDLDRVAGAERRALQQLTACGELARQRCRIAANSG